MPELKAPNTAASPNSASAQRKARMRTLSM